MQLPLGFRRGLYVDWDGTCGRKNTMGLFRKELASRSIIPSWAGSEAETRFRAYKARRQSFMPFVRELVPYFQNVLRGVSAELTHRVGREVVEREGDNVYIFPRELIRAAQDLGWPCFLISGGPSQLIQPLAERLGFTEWLASVYPHRDGVHTGDVPEEWVNCKDDAMRMLAEKYRISLPDSIAIGDTPSDCQMFQHVGYPVCFQPNPELDEVATQKGWPIVLEKKNGIYALVSHNGEQVRVRNNYRQILPEPLATRVLERLRDVRMREQSE